MTTTDIIDENRIYHLNEGCNEKEDYEKALESALKNTRIELVEIQSEYLENPTRDQGIKLKIWTRTNKFSTIVPPLTGYIVPIYLWDFLNQIQDYYNPDSEYYFYETMDPAIVYLSRDELQKLLDNSLTWIHPNWKIVNTPNQMRFINHNGNKITAVSIENL